MAKSENCVRSILATLVTVAVLLSTQLGNVQCVDVRVQPVGQVIKPTGSSVVFLCSLVDDDRSLSADASVQLQWIDNNNREITVKTGRRYIEQLSPTFVRLYLNDIGESDEGRYSCAALVDGKQFVKNVMLTIFEEISFVDTPSSQSLILGTTSLIRCTVTGRPVPTVSWKFAGRRVVSGGRYRIDSDGLHIADVSHADAGRYTCRAAVDADGRLEERHIEVAVHDVASERQVKIARDNYRLKKADIYRLLDKKSIRKTARAAIKPFACTEPPTSPYLFKCAEGTVCLPLDWVCDDGIDCPDLSDELNCHVPTADGCLGSYFSCQNGLRCVYRPFVCDGEDDCGDNSDELNCRECQSGSFLCKASSTCIRAFQVCDGNNDCGAQDDSDEQDCPISPDKRRRSVMKSFWHKN